MPEKIVKCVMRPNPDGVMAFSAEDGRDTSDLRFIYPDESGDLWYWTGPLTAQS